MDEFEKSKPLINEMTDHERHMYEFWRIEPKKEIIIENEKDVKLAFKNGFEIGRVSHKVDPDMDVETAINSVNFFYKTFVARLKKLKKE